MTTVNNNDRNNIAKPLEGEHDPPGEDQGVHSRFSADEVAHAFRVERERVVRAFSGEFGMDAGGTVDSTQAQHLAEVILGDRTQDEQEAALMKLGAYTPRRDTIAPSVSEKAPGEIEDTLIARERDDES